MSGPAVRIFTRATGYPHLSRRDAARLLADRLAALGWQALTTEDPGALTLSLPAGPLVFVFLNTTGTVLPPEIRDDLRRLICAGAGFAGIHSAADSEHDWPWFETLIGTRFQSHPLIQRARVVSLDGSHPSTAHLPASFTHREEWYNFTRPLPPAMRMLLAVDESTYRGGTMGAAHPLSWCGRIEKGRMWYTGLGHRRATFQLGWFQEHCLEGIRWACGETVD